MKTLVVVAVGEWFVRRSEVAVTTFRQHNPGWDVVRYYDQDLVDILPDKFKTWKDFDKCEIGRWCALRKVLQDGAEHALYCDGDFLWLGQHVSNVKAPLILTTHAIKPEANWMDFKRRMRDGMVNLGLIEAYKEADDLLTALIDRVCVDAERWIHKKKLWLQPPLDSVALVGYKTAVNTHPAVNLARWNIGLERQIVGSLQMPLVHYQDWDWPASSLHMSGYAHMRGRNGPVLDALIDHYELLLR